jgi:ABC-type transporter MlaC component
MVPAQEIHFQKGFRKSLMLRYSMEMESLKQSGFKVPGIKED